MPVLQIKTCPASVLRKKAEKVNSIDSSIVSLIDNMFETMYDAPGIGLAAPQVGVSLSIFILDIERKGTKFSFINPKIINQSGEETLEEGCLSIPGIFGDVIRAKTIELQGLDLNGNKRIMKAEGMLARAIQHELDHINGFLFWDRIDKVQRDILKRKYNKLKKG